jgi:hypothetical protein
VHATRAHGTKTAPRLVVPELRDRFMRALQIEAARTDDDRIWIRARDLIPVEHA